MGQGYGYRSLSAVRYFVIHHMGTDWSGDVVDAARATDRYHRETNGWCGIGYHWVVAGGEVAYVGSLDTSRANVANRNNEVVGILWAANGNATTPTVADYHALVGLLTYLRGLDWPQEIPQTVGHCELGPTACPGGLWPQWKDLLG